jgi:hypothetical protein
MILYLKKMWKTTPKITHYKQLQQNNRIQINL